MRTTIPARKRRTPEKPPVYRTPEALSDFVYQNFNSLAHRQKLTEGTAIYANRMCREESFTRDELLAIRAIIKGDEETAPLSGEVLGGDETLDWIESILEGRS